MRQATLAIIVKNGKVLLGRKKSGEIRKHTWNGPGGKLEKGESLEECVVRETREELDIQLDPTHLDKIAVITFFVGDTADFEVHVYFTDTFEGELHETPDMIPQWFDSDALPFEHMLESDREWFGRAVRGESFTAEVHYKERAKDFEKISFGKLK